MERTKNKLEQLIFAEQEIKRQETYYQYHLSKYTKQ
jgi:hypothetical protein